MMYKMNMMMGKVKECFRNIKNHLAQDDGVGVVEIILILVVLVALVVVFKSQLNTLVTNIFGSINKQAKTIY